MLVTKRVLHRIGDLYTDTVSDESLILFSPFASIKRNTTYFVLLDGDIILQMVEE